MFTVALTGGIGCGKSTICELFNAQGVPIIDTDQIAHQLVMPGMPALEQITSAFGNDMLTEDGQLDRQKLASQIFSDAEQKKQLESILHPLIRNEVQKQIEQLSTDYCIVAIPLLFETGQQGRYDYTLVVDCEEHQQVERTLARDGRTEQQIREIIKSQMPRTQRLKLADEIIDNRSTADRLIPQIDALHRKILTLAGSSIE